MGCEVEKHNDQIQIRGEMTIYNAVAVKDELFAAIAGLEGQPRTCAIDLSGVSEIDTTGLQTLLMVSRACRAGDIALTLVDPSAIVREALELLQVSAVSIVSPVSAVSAVSAVSPVSPVSTISTAGPTA